MVGAQRKIRILDPFKCPQTGFEHTKKTGFVLQSNKGMNKKYFKSSQFNKYLHGFINKMGPVIKEQHKL